MKSKLKLLLTTALLGSSLASCGLSFGSSQGSALYDWHNYTDVAYSYSKHQSPEQEEKLIKVYEAIIKRQRGERKVIPPGIYAEYGYLLAKKGKVQEGIALMKKEIALYPESATFIGRIIKQLEQR